MRNDVRTVLALVFLVLAPEALAARGTSRVARSITDTHPVFDCRSESYGTTGMKCDWNGATGTNDAVALQACIDAAAAVNGVAYIGRCSFTTGTTSIELNETVTLMGCGAGTGWAASQAEAEDACTLWGVNDSSTVALYIRGDGANQKGFQAGSGDWGSEGVRIQGIKFSPATATSGGVAIVVDGTYADEEVCSEPGTCAVDGCTTGTSCRGSVRSFVLDDIGCNQMGGGCIEMRGNVFDAELYGVNDYRSGFGIMHKDLADGACNNAQCRPGQIRVYDSLLNGCDRDLAYCDGVKDACTATDDPYVGCTGDGTGPLLDAWGASVVYTHFFGGNAQGDYGLALGFASGFFGVHFEGDELSASSIGLLLAGSNVEGMSGNMSGFDTCVSIGQDGDATQVDGYMVHIGNITNCDTYSVHSEDGGTRAGKFDVGNWGTDCGSGGATACDDAAILVDDRTGNAGEVVKQLLGVDLDNLFNVPVDHAKIGDGNHANQRLVFNEGELANNDPTMWFINATTLFQLTRDLMIGANGASACTGCSDDVVLTFDGADTNGTITLDEGIDRFVFSQSLDIAGSAPAVTAGAGLDLSLNVDDGQFVTPDTMLPKSCGAIASADPVALSDCNIAELTGSTNINTVNTCDSANKYRTLMIDCGAYTGDINDNGVAAGNMILAAGANFTCTADDVLVLLCDGTNWLEVSRSVN